MSQILNVYISKYETGGQFWPIAHNATIFAMIVAQIIALGVFGIKKSPVASGFTIPLIIGTLLFYEYCRQRFLPIFRNTAAEVANSKWKPLVCVCVFSFSQVQPCYCLNFQVLIEMDRKDKQCGRMEEIYQRLRTAYCQFTLLSKRDTSTSGCSSSHDSSENNVTDAESAKPGYNLTTSGYHSLKKPC